jgi:hypothetical protein
MDNNIYVFIDWNNAQQKFYAGHTSAKSLGWFKYPDIYSRKYIIVDNLQYAEQLVKSLNIILDKQ